MHLIKTILVSLFVGNALMMPIGASAQSNVNTDTLAKADAVFDKIRVEADEDSRKMLIGSLDPLINTSGLSPACKSAIQAQRMAAGLYQLADMTDDEDQAAPLIKEIKVKEAKAAEARKECLASVSASQTRKDPAGASATQSSATQPSASSTDATSFSSTLGSIYAQTLKFSLKNDVKGLKSLVPQLNALIKPEGNTASPECIKAAQARLKQLDLTIAYHSAAEDDEDKANQIMKEMSKVNKETTALVKDCK